MNFQSKRANCGAAALSNALEALGFRRTQEEMGVLAKTDGNGTSPRGLLAALRAVKESCQLQGPDVLQERAGEVALLRLLEALRAGRPAVLCCRMQEPWDHWAVAGGLLGSAGEAVRVVCIDSGDEELVLYKTPAELLPWWEGPLGVAKPYWGVIL